MFSVQGYAKLDAMFVAFRAERLATAEKKQAASGLDSQLPSEDDIEQEFLNKVSQALDPELIVFRIEMDDECEHNQGCSHRENPPPPEGLGFETTQRGSCYDDNEQRDANYYHDKANCDCPLCILDGREC